MRGDDRLARRCCPRACAVRGPADGPGAGYCAGSVRATRSCRRPRTTRRKAALFAQAIAELGAHLVLAGIESLSVLLAALGIRCFVAIGGGHAILHALAVPRSAQILASFQSLVTRLAALRISLLAAVRRCHHPAAAARTCATHSRAHSSHTGARPLSRTAAGPAHARPLGGGARDEKNAGQAGDQVSDQCLHGCSSVWRRRGDAAAPHSVIALTWAGHQVPARAVVEWEYVVRYSSPISLRP